MSNFDIEPCIFAFVIRVHSQLQMFFDLMALMQGVLTPILSQKFTNVAKKMKNHI